MAGSVTQTLSRLGRNLNSAQTLTFEWVGDASDGSVPTLATTSIINTQIAGWFITKVIINPGSPAPTANYSITLLDSNGLDLADAALTARSASTSETESMVAQVDVDGFTFTLTGNSVHSAEGVCKLFLNR